LGEREIGRDVEHDGVVPAAFSLNVRTLWAQVPVSILGKMLSTRVLPAKSAAVTSARLVPVKVNAGAGDPIAGRSPLVVIRLPRRVICAMAAT